MCGSTTAASAESLTQKAQEISRYTTHLKIPPLHKRRVVFQKSNVNLRVIPLILNLPLFLESLSDSFILNITEFPPTFTDKISKPFHGIQWHFHDISMTFHNLHIHKITSISPHVGPNYWMKIKQPPFNSFSDSMSIQVETRSHCRQLHNEILSMEE